MDEGGIRVEEVIPKGDVAILEIPCYPADVQRNTLRFPLVIQVPALPAPDQNSVAPLPIQAPTLPNPVPIPIADNRAVP